MDVNKMAETLRQLQTWRTQFVGMGLLLPDLATLIKLVEDDEHRIKDLANERARLEQSVSELQHSESRCAAEAEAHRIVHEGVLATMESEHNARVAAFEAERERSAKVKADLERELTAMVAAHETKKQAMQAEVDQAREELTRVKTDFEKFKKEHGLN